MKYLLSFKSAMREIVCVLPKSHLFPRQTDNRRNQFKKPREMYLNSHCPAQSGIIYSKSVVLCNLSMCCYLDYFSNSIVALISINILFFNNTINILFSETMVKIKGLNTQWIYNFNGCKSYV